MAARKKVAKKSPKKSPIAANVKVRNAEMDALTLEMIREAAKKVHHDISKHAKPDLSFPVRSLGSSPPLKTPRFIPVRRSSSIPAPRISSAIW